jgi:murein L,D-transpeptidase YcbB/YkuD
MTCPAGRFAAWARAGGVAFAAIGLFCIASVALGAEPDPGTVSRSDIRHLLASPDRLRIAGSTLDARALGRFYRARDFAPAWGAGDGGRERAALLLEALAGAESHGLDPGRYHLEAIRARRSSGSARNATEIELLLTDAFVRYATEIRAGRRIPGYMEPDWAIVAPRFDAVSTLTQALREPASFAAVLASLPPPAPDYRALVAALARYRALAARGGWPPMPAGTFLRPGDEEGRVTALRARLAAEDELVSRRADVRYDDLLAEAVRRFQARHGLAVDGIVGPETVQALNVPVTDRIQQIVVNLERWRWLPRELGRHHIVVNASDARLHVVADGRPVLTSRVVVGDLRHPTPVVQAWVDAVVLHPRWNVPTSIAVEEILPRLRENRRYLAENDIVVLERRESDPFGLAIDWAAIPADRFPFRLQQQPGPDNPLGRIKLDIPNRFDVYLHDTPTRALFARPVRTASHGCIRVERADDLAVHVLEDEAQGWTRQRLADALDAGETQRIPLTRPLPVYILYWTAFVEPDGSVQFRADVYGRDRRLAGALAEGDRGGRDD